VSKLVSVDLETTGLNPSVHETWEVGIVPVDPDARTMHYQFLPENLAMAEPGALKVNDFYEAFDWFGDPRICRDMLTTIPEDNDAFDPTHPDRKAFTGAAEACWLMAKELEGATIMGLNPHFGAAFLEVLLNRYGHVAMWSHRHLDLGSFAAGAWGAKHDLSGAAIRDRIPQDEGLHNAYADAQWNVEVYHSIVGSQV
jgi:hypothetical protein